MLLVLKKHAELLRRKKISSSRNQKVMSPPAAFSSTQNSSKLVKSTVKSLIFLNPQLQITRTKSRFLSLVKPYDVFQIRVGKIYTSFSSKSCTQSNYIVLTYRANVFLSVESNLRYHWFSFTTLYDWSRKLAPPSHPIRCKTKTNLNLVTRVQVRALEAVCMYLL